MMRFLWFMRVFWPIVTLATWLVAITQTGVIAVVYSVHLLAYAYTSAWWWSEYRDMEQADD